MSEIVPTHTKSRYFKYSSSLIPSFIEIACVNLNATPTPANPLNGYLLSFLLQSTTATASGNVSVGSWWSVTTVSIPNDFASSISLFPVIPQSTVIINVCLVSAISLIAFSFNPYPSCNLFGIYTSVSSPLSAKNLFKTVLLVIPSTS